MVEGGYGATVGQTGSESQSRTSYPRARDDVLDPIRELPYGPAANLAAARGRTDGSIRPSASHARIFACFPRGVHRCTSGSRFPCATSRTSCTPCHEQWGLLRSHDDLRNRGTWCGSRDVLRRLAFRLQHSRNRLAPLRTAQGSGPRPDLVLERSPVVEAPNNQRGFAMKANISCASRSSAVLICAIALV